MTTDLRASILAEAAEIAMHHPSKDAQAFACSVTDFLTSPVTPELPTEQQLYDLIRSTGYVTRGQAWDIVELVRAAILAPK